MGAVFLFNAAALFLFPPAGAALGLSQAQFGLWAALAVHDTSSVVGAASRYGPEALQVGITVKLVRALWILPLALGIATVLRRSRAGAPWPWFILLFCAAALANTYVPSLAPVFGGMVLLGRLGLAATLFLIGSGLTREALGRMGPRPLLHALLLWGVVAAGSLALIRAGWISV